MKIVIISPAHPLRGGIAASSERLAAELTAQGHDLVVYSFRLQYPSFLFPGKTQYTDDPTPPGLPIRTRLNSVNPFNWWAVGREIAAEHADRIIVRFWIPFMGPCLGTVSRVARWFSKQKPRVTALVDNIIPHEKRPGDRLFARYFIGACDDFVVMSEAVGREIATFTAKPVRFAPHPVYDIYGEPILKSAARAQLGVPADAGKVLLFFGLIRPYKGLDLLLEALADPVLADQPLYLLIAGECYDDWQNYIDQIERLKLGRRVHIAQRFIPNDEVRVFFSAADLVVQPYRTATQSGVLQVAYHFNLPVIVTRVGGLPEMIEEGRSGWVADPEPASIAQAIRRFCAIDDRRLLTEGVRSVKTRFSWTNLAQVMLDA